MSDIVEKKTVLFVFLKDSMYVGGIETFIFKLTKHIVESGERVLLVLNNNAVVDESYSELIGLSQVELLYNRFCLGQIKKTIEKYRIKKVNIITFEMIRFSFADFLKKRLVSRCDVSALYFVPHFKGFASYPEEPYSGRKREKVRKRFKAIVHKMNSNDSIRYFSDIHVIEMTKRYEYDVNNEARKYLPKRGVKRMAFDENRCLNLARRTRFNILAVSRLEFPHKGFFIGLIQTYGELKKKYPNISLTIVGYGDGLGKVMDEIKKLDSFAQSDIYMVGKVAPDNLMLYYNDANVCVSLAGCFTIGAKNGTLSLPVRHYSYSCETYGFLPESKNQSLSEEPGEPIRNYLEKIINMDTQTYVTMCKRCYDSYMPNPNKVRETIYSLSDGSNKTVMTISDVVFLLFERAKNHVKMLMRKLL